MTAPRSTLQTVAVSRKFKTEGGDDAAVVASMGMGDSPIPVSPMAAGMAGADDDDPYNQAYNPCQPNDYMAYCREVKTRGCVWGV